MSDKPHIAVELEKLADSACPGIEKLRALAETKEPVAMDRYQWPVAR